MLLFEQGHLADYPRLGWESLEKRARVSELTLRHELAVMDVKAAMITAVIKTPGLSVAEFSTWPLLYQFRASPGDGPDVLVKPDGYVRILENRGPDEVYEHTFFIEVDRSTEPQETLARRAACYLDYYRRGGLAARNGQPREQYKEFPFRVLMVFRNPERRNNVADRLLRNRPAILTLTWLTTLRDVLANSSNAIWIRPVDYRRALDGTAFEPSLHGKNPVYRRQSEREALVDAKVVKWRLISKEGRDHTGDERKSTQPERDNL